MSEITGITGAALAELKLLYAAATYGPSLTPWSEFASAAILAFPSLLARLEAAEREREELRKQNRITQAKLENMAIDCGQAEGQLKRLREDIATRDARMKKLGAAEAFKEMQEQAIEVGKSSGLAAKFCKMFAEECVTAAQLRREGGE